MRGIWLKTVQNRLGENSILTITLLVGLGLRCLPVLCGAPVFPFVGLYHPDEWKVARDVYAFPEIYFTNQFYIYGSACQYFLGILLFPLKVLIVWLKVLPGAKNYWLLCIVFSRLFSVATGTIAIFLGYLISSELFDRKTALATAVFICLSFYHCLNSSLSTLDVPMSSLLLINFLACMRALETEKIKDYLLLGVASGLLLGTKIVGGIFLVIPTALICRKILASGHWLSQSKRLAGYILVALCVLMMTTPHIFLHPRNYYDTWMQVKTVYYDNQQRSFFEMLKIWGSNTIAVVGWPVAILFFIGVMRCGKKDLPHKCSLLLFASLHYLFFRSDLLPRYIIIVAPIFCIFAAWGCVSLIQSNSEFLKYSGIASLCAAIAYSACLCIAGISMRFNDTRTQAARYIAENIPRGETIGIGFVSETFGWREHIWQYSPINFKTYKESSFLNKPTIVVLSSYDFERMEAALKSPKLSKDYQWDEKYNNDWYLSSPPSPNVFKFYDELLNNKGKEYVLIKTFTKRMLAPIEFPPPEIRIYRKNLNQG